jgi:hypothetical protein
MKTIVSMVSAVLAVTLFLFGCTDKEAERRAKEAQKEQEKQAIIKAFLYVNAIHSTIEHPANLGELVMGVSRQRKARYVEDLKRTPLEGCPIEFQEAFQRHIAAWKDGAGDEKAIRITMLDLMALARMRGVE